MLALPIPLITSLVLAFLLLHMLLQGGRPKMLAVLVAACALQGIVVSLVQHYGIEAFRIVQPITATLIPPLAWLAFQSTAIRKLDPRRDLLHLAVPAFTIFCMAFAPARLDLVIAGIFLIYGLMIAYVLIEGGDALPLTRIETGDRPRLIFAGIALGLILSSVSDGLIALALMMGEGWLQPVILSLFTSLSLGLVGALTLSQNLAHGGDDDAVGLAPDQEGGIDKKSAPPWLSGLFSQGQRQPHDEDAAKDPVSEAIDQERDADIMAKLDRLLKEETLYLDANLTLERLARRLLVPSKQLSAAINRTTGGNVSRYVNGFRIEHACEHLKAGDGVTKAMLESGFNTKSNFNREFLRVKGCPPSRWLTLESES